ncbi:MAG: hypothetical protein QG675_596 [Patescibacteria group bacterium]|nr:hypothetical protein [Patescibacteria group bacterium]
MEPQNPQMPVTNQAPDNIMPPPPQKSSKVWIVLTIILAISLIAVSVFGYYKWQQYRTLAGNLGARINALENQVKALQSDQSITSTTTSKVFRNIPELGVKYPITTENKELSYEFKSRNDNGVVFGLTTFSSVPLVNSEAKLSPTNTNTSPCSVNSGALGSIGKYNEGQKYFDKPVEQLEGEFVKRIGNSYYVYTPPQSSCSTNAEITQLQTQSIPIAKEMFKNLTAI